MELLLQEKSMKRIALFHLLIKTALTEKYHASISPCCAWLYMDPATNL